MNNEEKKKIVNEFLEKRKEGKKAEFQYFKSLDPEQKRIVLLYQLDETENLLKAKLSEDE